MLARACFVFADEQSAQASVPGTGQGLVWIRIPVVAHAPVERLFRSYCAARRRGVQILSPLRYSSRRLKFVSRLQPSHLLIPSFSSILSILRGVSLVPEQPTYPAVNVLSPSVGLRY